MIVDAALRRIECGWQVMESQPVPRGPFVFGDRPGALDIAIAVDDALVTAPRLA